MSLPQYGLGMGVGLKPEQQVTHALKQLQSCTPMVRLRAREALLDMPAKALTPYIDQITQAIDARDARARQTALLLLQRLPTTSVSSVLPQVIPALEDLDADVQRAALDVLRNFTPSVCSRYGEHIVNLYERSTRASVKVTALYASALLPDGYMVKACADYIFACLKDSDVNVRWTALDVLKEKPALLANRLPEVIESLGDADRYVRWQAMSVIAKSPTSTLSSSMEGLKDKLLSAHASARGAAVIVMCRLSVSLVEPYLDCIVDRLRDEHASVRWATLHSLGHLPSDLLNKHVDRLKERLEDEDRWVRRGAASIMRRMPPDVVDADMKEKVERVYLETEDEGVDNERDASMVSAMEDSNIPINPLNSCQCKQHV